METALDGTWAEKVDPPFTHPSPVVEEGRSANAKGREPRENGDTCAPRRAEVVGELTQSPEEGVAGLVHISEFENEEDLKNTLSLGQSYSFTISLFEPKDQRMTLTYKKESA